ncbi:MAG: FtsX-like permease family protein [Pirellulales bacterium]
MTPNKLIWKELRQRPTAMVTCLLAITLGVTALVAIRSVTLYSECAVAEQMEALGANVLLLPQAASLHDYYSADAHGATLPEEYATQLALANLEGVQKISPKLSVPAELGGRRITLTGILPQSEFEAKAGWQSVQVFSKKHAGCKKQPAMNADARPESENLATGRFVREMRETEVYVGADVAKSAGVTSGDCITLSGLPFVVSGVIPATGTADDGRVFAHLHTVQRLADRGETVNVIEIIACCEDAAGGLVVQLGDMFPDAKVVTITQVVDTQVAVNRLMTRLSYLFFGILLVVGVSSIAGTMFANVTERRREIGTLMALGATPSVISRLFLGKALIIGLAGGLLGYLSGTLLAVGAGPYWAGIAVRPVLSLAAVAVALAGVVALVASYLPARRAALIDPCLCFREV